MVALITSRRRFISGLGLGAGAALLAPLGHKLIGDALAAPSPRKRVLFFLHSNGSAVDRVLVPDEFPAGEPSSSWPTVPMTQGFTMPEALAPLAGHQDKMMIVDGLSGRGSSESHTTGYLAMSFAGNGTEPVAPSIDQLLAQTLSEGLSRRSVLFGIDRDGVDTSGPTPVQAANQISHTFAAGAGQPLPVILSANLLRDQLFAGLEPGGVDYTTQQTRRRIVLDGISDDIRRLDAALASPEKQKLEHYLGALDEYDKRQAALETASCELPAEFGEELYEEYQLEDMMRQAALAIGCGLTGVVGVSQGCGNPHKRYPRLRKLPTEGTEFGDAIVGTPFANRDALEIWQCGNDHDGDKVYGLYAPVMKLIHGWNASMIARLVDTLEAMPEGDGTVMDNTLIVYLSENGERHHSQRKRWTPILIGDLGGSLVSGGRYVRYPKHERTLGEFFITLTHAIGAPIAELGGTPQEPTATAPIGELLT